MKALLSPENVVRTQVAIILVALVVGLGSLVYVMQSIDRSAESAVRDHEIALAVTRGEVLVSEMIGELDAEAWQYVASEQFLGLNSALQRVVRDELARTDGAQQDPLTESIALPVSATEAVMLQRSFDDLISLSEDVIPGAEADPRVLEVGPHILATANALDAYLSTPTVANMVRLRNALRVLEADARSYAPDILADSTDEFASLGRFSDLARTVLPLGLAVLGLLVLGIVFIVGRRLHAALEVAEHERVSLAYRNDQLNSLYTVFSEISDTLTLHYVVTATVREAQKLVRANIVVMRLLKRAELVGVGSVDEAGNELEGLSVLELGEGLVGRVARRGRTQRVDNDADEAIEFADGEEWAASMRSCIIVPLIVGARVQGTLECWSRQPNAFSEDDQRILEMMASQVATAIAAADTTETSQRQAFQDSLTGLANRRQLNRDLAGDLTELAASNTSAVVAMIDIDNFKRFNDDFGHAVGDVTLQRVAAVLRSTLRESDRVYRYGGEEFVVILIGVEREAGMALAERLRAAVEATPLTGASMEPVGPVTISVGLACLPEHGSDFNYLLELADDALYLSKQAGRNRVTMHEAQLSRPAA